MPKNMQENIGSLKEEMTKKVNVEQVADEVAKRLVFDVVLKKPSMKSLPVTTHVRNGHKNVRAPPTRGSTTRGSTTRDGSGRRAPSTRGKRRGRGRARGRGRRDCGHGRYGPSSF